MWRGGESRHADVPDGLTDLYTRPAPRRLRECAEVAVARHKTVSVSHFDRVAVAALSAGEDDNPVADGTHWRALRGGVVGPCVLAPDTEDRMLPHAEYARDATELERCP